MRKSRFALAALLAILAPAAPALGQTMFTATLNGTQEVPPVGTMASGSATLTLNAAQDALTYTVTLVGLDLDGNQTPADPNDDVIAMHLHRGAPGMNGPVVFGQISPGQDPDDIMINPVAGTVSGIWETTDAGAASPLGTELPFLLAGNLYFNIHTPANPGGEIRGQVVQAPVVPVMGPLGYIVLLVLLSSGGALWLKRRYGLSPTGA